MPELISVTRKAINFANLFHLLVLIL